MINEKLIEKYFSKRLSEDELKEFEHLYTTDAIFKEEVDFLTNVQSVSAHEDDAEFKSELASYESEYSEKKTTSIQKWLKPFAALAAILLIALTLNFFLNREINEEQLFSNYFEPSKNVSAPIVRSETDENSLNNAFIAYGETNYEQAILQFEKAFSETKNSELLFYEGNALLASGKTEQAIKKFEEHLMYSDILTNRSHWYLALAHLKKKDTESAKKELNALINSGEKFKKEEANSLLKQLD